MKFFIYISVCLAAAFVQTVLLPQVPSGMIFYDPLLVFVLCTAKKTGMIEGCLFSIFSGLYMDGLSSGGIGFFLASYVWFYFTVRLAGIYFRIESPLVTVMLLVIGIIIQNTVFYLPEFAGGRLFLVDRTAIVIIRSQTLWAILTGFPLYGFFAKIFDKYWRMSERSSHEGVFYGSGIIRS